MFHRYKFFFALITFLFVTSTSYFLYIEERGNFHPITEGEAYRSAQLDSDELEYYIDKYNIKSILNLRGKNPDAPWYVEEIEISKEHNVMHYDIPLSASHEPGNDDIQMITEIFRSAPRPILIHCRGGADRSGLAAAMWKVIVDKEPKSEGGKQLSILYGHIPIGGPSAMNHFFENWKPKLKMTDPATFITSVDN
jgi:protein tyrosine/serine phosphatase